MKDRKYYVYDHISPSGKHYIGITCQRLSQRWGKDGKNYLKKLKNGNYRHPAFAAAIEKYGWDAFEHSVLFHNCSEELAKKLECAYIAYWTKRRLSYNCTDGGDTGMRPKKTPEEKRARRKAYEATEEYKAKRRERCNRYRKEHLEEINAQQREKQATDDEYREKRKAACRKWYQEHKEEISVKNKANREELTKKYKEWKAKNPDKVKAYREAHKEESNKRASEWQKAHPEKARAASLKCYYKHKNQKV